MNHVICARYASNIWDFSKKTNIVIFLSSGVARQHRKAHDDIIALLFYGFSNFGLDLYILNSFS